MGDDAGMRLFMIVRTRFASTQIDTLDMIEMGLLNCYNLGSGRGGRTDSGWGGRTLANGTLERTCGSARAHEPLRFVDDFVATSDG
jgi:hypothetical protein